MAGTVARPKIYIDYISYFRAIGVLLRTGRGSYNIQENYDDVYVYNPSKTKSFTPIDNTLGMQFNLNIGTGTDEVSKLVSSMNFGAVLNHNIETLDYSSMKFNAINGASGTHYDLSNVTEFGDTKNNFRLFSWDSSEMKSYGIGLSVDFNTSPDINNPLKLGSIIAGRTFTFPHNANLSMNINNETNIRKTRTLGGADIVDINYYRQPLWDGYPPFVATNDPSFSATSSIGRRSWALTFSFLTQNSTFPQDMSEGFMFDNYTPTEGVNTWNNYTTENITSHFMTLSLNGQLPFLFQPDYTKDVYAWCRLKSNTFSVQQSAPNLYTSKMTFEEVW